ncbi:hypothetical protein TanjilG_09339 [Lupinus angustifolius]|uniref:Uncharacterized protein n=1 Tax=Lupinus angustifolius TaxID=3871 RepID=A0A4P1RMY0_LUPAN|nr:hypothetical protein TanjilG_09339 [Lupinus angustifolius]
MKLSKEFGAHWVGITLAKAQGHTPDKAQDHAPNKARQARSEWLTHASVSHSHIGKTVAPDMDNMVTVMMDILAHLTLPR